MLKALGLQSQLLSFVGKQLAELRGNRFNQSALAQEAGLTRAAISAIEGGQQGVSLVTLCQLALCLEVEPAALLPTLARLRELASSSDDKAQGPPIPKERSAAEIVDDFLKGNKT